MFADKTHAKKFFIDKIIAQARIDDVNLSTAEIYMLGWSEVESDFKMDQKLNESFYNETTDEKFEAKVVQLIYHAYEKDLQVDGRNEKLYEDAYNTLTKGDYYIAIMVDMAMSGDLPDNSLVAQEGKWIDSLVCIITGVALIISMIYIDSINVLHIFGKYSSLIPLFLVVTLLSLYFNRVQLRIKLYAAFIKAIIYFLCFSIAIYYLYPYLNYLENTSFVQSAGDPHGDVLAFVVLTYFLGLISVLFPREFIDFFKMLGRN